MEFESFPKTAGVVWYHAQTLRKCAQPELSKQKVNHQLRASKNSKQNSTLGKVELVSSQKLGRLNVS